MVHCGECKDHEVGRQGGGSAGSPGPQELRTVASGRCSLPSAVPCRQEAASALRGQGGEELPGIELLLLQAPKSDKDIFSLNCYTLSPHLSF